MEVTMRTPDVSPAETSTCVSCNGQGTTPTVRCTASRLPRYADPWGFLPSRRRSRYFGPQCEEVSDLYGRRRSVYVFKDGRLVPIGGSDFSESIDCAEPGPKPLLEPVEIRVLREYNKWTSSGLFTLKQLGTIRALWIERIGLHA